MTQYIIHVQFSDTYTLLLRAHIYYMLLVYVFLSSFTLVSVIMCEPRLDEESTDVVSQSASDCEHGNCHGNYHVPNNW